MRDVATSVTKAMHMDKNGEPKPAQASTGKAPRLDPNSPAWLAAKRRSRKRLLIVAGFVAIVCGSLYTYWTTGAGEDEAGREALKAKKYDEAIDHFTRAIRGNPKNADAYLGRSQAYLTKGELRKALDDSDKVVMLAPNAVPGHLIRAKVLQAMGKPSQAVAALNNALRGDPNAASIYLTRAYLGWRNAVKDTDPLADVTKALQLDPDLAAGYSLEALIYYDKKDYDKAFTAAKKALDLNAGDAEAHFVYGVVLRDKRGKQEEGQREIDRALQLEPGLKSLLEQPKKKPAQPK